MKRTAKLTPGMAVKVYKNLHNGLFSVMHKGLVIAHVESVNLDNVRFTVQPAGRAKVIATKRKQVHAFVCGTIPAFDQAHGYLCNRVSYNPYKAGTFTNADGSPALTAIMAAVTATGVFI